MNVADVILDVLAEAGARHLFGIPGDAINDLIDAVRRQDAIRFVHVAHEESGAMAASAMGKLGVELTAVAGTAGPGAIHLLNGLYDAKLDGAPVVAITGQVERRLLGTRAHQEIDAEALFEDVCVFNATVTSAEQLPDLVVRACREAILYKGVAHLSVPQDVMAAKVAEPGRRGTTTPPRVRVTPEPDALDRAAKRLQASSKVAILAGAGCHGAVDELVALAGRLKAPIVRSLRAKELLPDEHPLSIGGHGLLGTRAASEAFDACEVLLVVGSDFPYLDFYPDDAAVIQIDVDPARIGARSPVEVGVLGDAQLAMQGLLERLEPAEEASFLEEHQRAMARWTERMTKAEEDESAPIRPQRAAKVLGDVAPPGTVFTCDTGAVTVWGARHLRLREGSRFTLSGGLATMGYAMPGAIGAQLAFPDRKVVGLVGDGSMHMLLGEFTTAVRYELPITLVVFNNSKLGLIQMEQESAGFPESETSLPSLDFAAFARLAGGGGRRVEEPGELEEAFREALESPLPFVVDVQVNPEELTVPPRIELKYALGFALAKAKEVLGAGDRDAGPGAVLDALR